MATCERLAASLTSSSAHPSRSLWIHRSPSLVAIIGMIRIDIAQFAVRQAFETHKQRCSVAVFQVQALHQPKIERFVMFLFDLVIDEGFSPAQL